MCWCMCYYVTTLEKGNEMTSTQIEKILEGKFEKESDREYWIDQLEAAKIREATIANNEKYFAEMVVYNR